MHTPRGAATFFVLLIVLWAGLSWSARPKPPHPASLVVKVVLPESMGSGTPVAVRGNQTAILTARHVVEDESMSLPTPMFAELAGRQYPVVQVCMHPELDVAIVWVEGRLPVVPMDHAPAVLGQRVQACGWLFGVQLQLDEGLVCEPDKASVDMLPGCSGGSIFREGEIVGVVSKTISISSPFGGIPVGACVDFVPIADAWRWICATLDA